MSVLHIIAEQGLGPEELAARPHLRAALERMDAAARRPVPSPDEKARISSIVELCFAFSRERDPEERANLLRTLEEISAAEPLVLPTTTVEQWERGLEAGDVAFAQAKREAARRRRDFARKYFSLRAKAGLATQAAVARQAGLRRSYVAVIEAGDPLPQQKTLQKLAKAFGVDVSELLV